MSLEVLCYSGPPDLSGFWPCAEFLSQHLEWLEGCSVVCAPRPAGGKSLGLGLHI